MDNSYYFSQGRLISTYPYSKYTDKNNETIILLDKDKKDTDNGNKDKNDWIKIFNGYKFQIFSPSILRYK